MRLKVGSWRKWLFTTAICTSMLNPFGFIHAADFDGSGPGRDRDTAASLRTESPIKHVIILIGENRGLDHTFGVYKPKGRGQTISNILSKGIVNEDGTPGPNFGLATQFAVSPQPLYYIGAPNGAKTPYSLSNPMPQPNTNGATSAQSDTAPPFKTAAEASVEPDIQAKDVLLMTTGATGLPNDALDTRIPGAGNLPNGPFVLKGMNISDDDYTGDMTHRFYQAFVTTAATGRAALRGSSTSRTARSASRHPICLPAFSW